MRQFHTVQPEGAANQLSAISVELLRRARAALQVAVFAHDDQLQFTVSECFWWFRFMHYLYGKVMAPCLLQLTDCCLRPGPAFDDRDGSRPEAAVPDLHLALPPQRRGAATAVSTSFVATIV